MSPASARALTSYHRTKFTIPAGAKYGTVTLKTRADDGVAVYVNGTEVGRSNLPGGTVTSGTYALSAGYYDAFYGQAQKVRTLICRDFAAAYERFDVLLSPTSPTTAFELGAIHDPLTMYLNDICTIPSNLAGHPAMSVPYGPGADGLPVGVQILAPSLGETAMFRVAAALEATAPTPVVAR